MQESVSHQINPGIIVLSKWLSLQCRSEDDAISQCNFPQKNKWQQNGSLGAPFDRPQNRSFRGPVLVPLSKRALFAHTFSIQKQSHRGTEIVPFQRKVVPPGSRFDTLFWCPKGAASVPFFLGETYFSISMK